MRLTDELWRPYFAEPRFEHSAFRYEAQPTYTMPNEQERIALWRTGAAKPENHNAAWHEKIRALVATGRTVSRVRIVNGRLTDYQRYSFQWSIPGNTAAGEDVRVLDLADHPGLLLPRLDWWLFDEQVLVRLDFNDDGTQRGRELVQDPDLPEYVRLRDLVTRLSVPFAQYAAEYRP